MVSKRVWASKWYKSKGGGWRGGSKKKAAGGPTGDPIPSKVQAGVDSIMSNYFGHLNPTQQSQIANAIFLDENSIDRTTKLIESGNMEDLARSIAENPLAKKLLKGEKIGISGAMRLGKEILPDFKNLSDLTNITGRDLITQGFQDVRDLKNLGYDNMAEDINDTKAFEVLGTLNDPPFLAPDDINQFRNYTPKAMGGPISGASEGDLMKIQNGGTHEESPLGGVPIGKDADGREVLVEEGETIRKGAEEDFVFSDRLKLTKQEAEEFGIDKKFVGQSFATVSEKLEKRSPRKSDPIDRQTLDMHLNKLEEAQETFKQRKLAEAKEMYGDPEAEMQQGPQGLPPDAMPGVGTETPPSPEQFAGSPPEVQAMLAQRFPEQFGGGAPQGPPPGMPAGMPQGAGPMMMPHGGRHYTAKNLMGSEVLPMGSEITPEIQNFINYVDTGEGGDLLSENAKFKADATRAQFLQETQAGPSNYGVIEGMPMPPAPMSETPMMMNKNADPISGLPTLRGINQPVTQGQFDTLTQGQKASYAEAFPGRYRISADTPTLEQLRPKMKPHGGPKGSFYHPDMPEYGYGDETNVPNYIPFSPTRNTVSPFNPMPSFLQASQEQLDQSALESNYIPEIDNSSLDIGALEDAESRGAASSPFSINDLTKVLGTGKEGDIKYGAAMSGDSGDSENTKEFPDYETPKGLNAVQAAPIAANLVTAAMLPEQFDWNDYQLPIDDNILQKKDISPMIRDVERMVATGRGALQSRAGSVSELLAGLSNLTAVGMAETGKIRNQQYEDYVQELRNQQLFNLSIAKENAGMRAAVDTANADLEKERLSLINSAATEASKFADALRQESLSKYELEQLYTMYPYLNK